MKDLIDRQAVVKIINDELEYTDNTYATLKCITIGRAVNDLPSAHPEHLVKESGDVVKDLVKDTISRQAAIDAIHEDADWLESQGSDWQVERKERDLQILVGLPSAQPERKKGKWLLSGNCIFPYECDQCGDTNERATPFCPNCGADMREGDAE